MKRIVKMIIVCMAITAVPAMAVERTGNDIRIDCSNLIESESSESLSKEKVLGVGYCIGMIDGLVTFNYVYETVLETRGDASMVQMCLPERVSTRQLAGVIVKYLEANSGRLQQSGQALAAQALVTAYPCDQEESKDE